MSTSWANATGGSSNNPSSFTWTHASEHHKMFGKERMPDQLIELELSLEELCQSGRVRYNITRSIEDEFKRVQTQKIPVDIPVKAGWKAGTKVTFEGHGDETFLRAAANVIFVVKELPHAWAERRGDDLLTTISIPLEQALSGGVAEFKDIITGQRKKTSFTPLANSTTTLRIPEFGMPVLNGNRRGDLIVRFNIILRSD